MAKLLSCLKQFSKDSIGKYDAIVVLSSSSNPGSCCDDYVKDVQEYLAVNENAGKEVSVIASRLTIRRLIFSPLGPLNRDVDDVRRFRDAAFFGLRKALSAGATNPLICLPSERVAHHVYSYDLAEIVAMMGALEAIYTPLEIRELDQKKPKVESISFCNETCSNSLAVAIEAGRIVCRDIGGSDPERMSAPKVADYVKNNFTDSVVKVEVVEDEREIKSKFPCLAAVDRGSAARHKARVIFLRYQHPEDTEFDSTLVLVGKGVTYDTGGHDIKAGGIMAGMHRDKCGAAAVAGFFETLKVLQPRKIRVIGAMSMVRNSIGPDAYVADELITARSGVRLRVGNTDAEGRMAMVDVLCYFKEEALKNSYKNPKFFTIATLTGHACLAVGDNYSIILENGPAKKESIAKKIQEAGDKIGDLFEVSTIRREDYDFNKGKSEYEDILQSNNLPSSRTPRGHQAPAAFLATVSGLDKHGLDSKKPFSYSHIDIAGSSGPFPGIPTGAPIPALAVAFLSK